MNWKQLTSDLIQSGLTQAEIAKAIGCGQTTISELQTGKTDNPRSSVGLALIALANSKGIVVEITAVQSTTPNRRDPDQPRERRNPDAPDRRVSARSTAERQALADEKGV